MAIRLPFCDDIKRNDRFSASWFTIRCHRWYLVPYWQSVEYFVWAFHGSKLLIAETTSLEEAKRLEMFPFRWATHGLSDWSCNIVISAIVTLIPATFCRSSQLSSSSSTQLADGKIVSSSVLRVVSTRLGIMDKSRCSVRRVLVIWPPEEEHSQACTGWAISSVA